MASRKDTVEFSQKNTVCIQNCLKYSEKHVSCLQNYLRRKFVCIRRYRKEFIIDLCCNMDYSLLCQGRRHLFLAGALEELWQLWPVVKIL